MSGTSREETLPHTNKPIKTVELSRHNCDIGYTVRRVMKQTIAGPESRPLHVACE